MQYRVDKYGNELSVLGYGCMRFTRKGSGIDIDKAEKEIMAAFEAGVNYYDTAYIYPGSEAALGEILERNGIREKVNIATKVPQFLVRDRAALDKYFREQLSRLRTDYIDYYLMHHVTDVAMWEKLKAVGILDWIRDKKERHAAQGRARSDERERTRLDACPVGAQVALRPAGSDGRPVRNEQYRDGGGELQDRIGSSAGPSDRRRPRRTGSGQKGHPGKRESRLHRLPVLYAVSQRRGYPRDLPLLQRDVYGVQGPGTLPVRADGRTDEGARVRDAVRAVRKVRAALPAEDTDPAEAEGGR